MIDTPMDNNKTERLVDFVESHLGASITLLIIGHFHSDYLVGLEFIQSKGIRSMANALTIAKCRELKLPVPDTSFTGMKLECRYWPRAFF